MQGRQHQVSRLSSLQTDCRRLLVAYFAHAYHVRILPQYASQRLCESDVRFGIYFDLACVRQQVFYRVFYGYHVSLEKIDAAQHPVKRSRLARPRRPAYKYHSIWFCHSFGKLCMLLFVDPDITQAFPAG